MRVGVDARELQGRPTGMGRYLRSLLDAWLRSGTDELFCYLNGPLLADPVLHGPRVRSCSVGDGSDRGTFWLERRLPPIVRQDGLDVFFSPAYVCPLGVEVPRVVSVHDLSFFAIPDDFTLRDGLRRRLLVSASVRAAQQVIVGSDFTRRELLRFFPEQSGRVAQVPYGGDESLPPPPERSTARRRLGLSGPLVLTVGSILNRRRLPDLLRAIAMLSRRWPSLVLDVVGDNRTHPRLDLAALAHRLGIGDHVRLSGFVSEAELADRYAAADVAVFVSEYEGFGLPALEAMRRGVPVVVSNRPALDEVFGEAALVVDPRDVPGIAAALDRVLREPALASDLRARGAALAARYSWEECARRTREVLDSAARA